MPRNSTFYKPFDKKYVVCTRDCNGEPEITIFGEDTKGNRIPEFFDTKADALIAIGEHIVLLGEAVKRNNMSEDSLDDFLSDFLAEATLNKEGHLYVHIVDEHGNIENIFDDNIIKLMT